MLPNFFFQMNYDHNNMRKIFSSKLFKSEDTDFSIMVFMVTISIVPLKSMFIETNLDMTGTLNLPGSQSNKGIFEIIDIILNVKCLCNGQNSFVLVNNQILELAFLFEINFPGLRHRSHRI